MNNHRHRHLLALSSLLLCLLILNATATALAQTSLTRTYYAAEPIKAGDFVMGNANATISRAGLPGALTESRYGKNVAKIMDIQALTPQSALVCYQSISGAYRLVAVTIDSSGKTKIGNELIFGGYFIVLDATHAVTFNAGRGDVRIVTISGTTLTMGPIALTTPGYYLSLMKVEPERILAIYLPGAGVPWQAQLYKMSGDQLVAVGNTLRLPLNDSYDHSSYKNAFSINAGMDRTIIATSYSWRIILGSTSNVLQLLWNMPYSAYSPICSLGNGAFLMNRGDCYAIEKISAAGLSDDQHWVNFPIAPNVIPAATSMQDKAYFVCGKESGWIANDGSVPVMYRMGRWISDLPLSAECLFLSKQRILMAYPVPGSLQLGVRTLPPFGDASNYQGVAEQTVSAGEACKVTLPGGVTRRFSNLEMGRVYYFSENGPVLSTAADRMVVGKAISPTEMLVWFED